MSGIFQFLITAVLALFGLGVLIVLVIALSAVGLGAIARRSIRALRRSSPS